MLEDILKNGLKAGVYMIVKSWENDGDANNTITEHYENVDVALFEAHLLHACAPMYNAVDWDYQDNRVKAFPQIVDLLSKVDFPEWVEVYNSIKDVDFNDSDAINELDELWDFIIETTGSLVGYSEVYYMRVVESISIHYVKEGVKADVTQLEYIRPSHKDRLL